MTMVSLDYDIDNPQSIEAYAKKLVNHSFRFVANLPCPFPDPKGGKGNLGVLVEEHYFQYRANSDQRPDLGEVELKTTPYEIKKNGEKRAGERLVLTMIDYGSPVVYDFYKSHLWEKCRLLLLIIYLRDKNAEDNLDYIIKFVKLFTPPDTDIEIILEDYRYIIEKIAAGLAHELSESQTKYLGACTKGSTAESSWIPQYYSHEGNRELAKRRAFCFKQPYMTYVLNNYIDVETDKSESIFKTVEDLGEDGFFLGVERRIENYIGMSDTKLAARFGISSTAKNLWSMLTFSMLGIKTNNAAEFVKAGVVVKAIRLEENGTIMENMSFPALSLKRLAADAWEDSEIYDQFGRTMYLFVVFQRCGDRYRLRGSEFWSMPVSDLEGAVRRGWEEMHRIVGEGVVLKKSGILSRKGNPVVQNNLPGQALNPIIHLRPHTKNVYYKLKDGTEFGNPSDGDELPNGEWMTKQCVWLNRNYVLSQLREDLKN